MKYAIASFAGHQYKFSEGDILTVDLQKADPDSEIIMEQVLLVVDGDKVQIGTPIVDKVKVTAKVLNHLQGDKIRVSTYKAKSRYRRVKGFRPQQTKLQIVSIK